MSQRNRYNKKHLHYPIQLQVRKSTGSLERFSPSKLQASLVRCGAPTPDAKEITRSVRSFKEPELSTESIRKFVVQRLKNAYPAVATRYELSRSVIKLGPTGFPFEKLIGQLYQSEGYQAQTNQTRPGRCVNHEIDVVAVKGNERIFVECKFHQTSGTICDLKTALYVSARSQDLNKSQNPSSRHTRFVLLTNTRFSSEAIAYGQCVGLELVGWTHPEKNSLSHRLEVSGLIPLTALTSIPRRLTEHLMLNGIITVLDLIDTPSSWKMLGNNPKFLNRVQSEIDRLFEIVT